MEYTREMLEGLHTPCFVFDEAELQANFRGFSSALAGAWPGRSHVAYSVKTNPLPWVLRQAHRAGCMAEFVSDEEFSLALSCGFEPSDVVFNGPVKGRAWLEYALRAGALVNLDSERELRWVAELAAAGVRGPAAAPLAVGVRVNVDLERALPGQTIGGSEPGRFGFSHEDGTAARVIERLGSIAGVRVAGLHLHVTTYGRQERAYELLAAHAVALARACGIAGELEWVDMGGGYYGGGERNAGRYEGYAAAMARVLREAFDPTRTALVVEPGGSVVCTPAVYVGRVVDAKDVRGVRFVVSELSRLDIDHEQKKTSYPHVLYARPGARLHPDQVLCGFPCLESDRLCHLSNEPELAEGDLVLIRYAGAYSMSFTPGFFIEGAPAAYAWRAGDGFELLRDRTTPNPPRLS